MAIGPQQDRGVPSGAIGAFERTAIILHHRVCLPSIVAASRLVTGGPDADDPKIPSETRTGRLGTSGRPASEPSTGPNRHLPDHLRVVGPPVVDNRHDGEHFVAGDQAQLIQ